VQKVQPQRFSPCLIDMPEKTKQVVRSGQRNQLLGEKPPALENCWPVRRSPFVLFPAAHSMPALDDAAFEACYRRVFPIVLAKCRRMLRGHADALDVTQEVFIRLWEHRELVEDHRALTAWLYRTSTRLVIDRARLRQLSQASEFALQTLVGESHDEFPDARLASRRQLQVVFREFPDQELHAAILNRFDRLTHPEIAEVMGVSERTVRRLLARFDERASTLKESA